MKTSIPSTAKDAQNLTQSSHASLARPQSGRLAQLAAMMNQSPRMQAQFKLAEEIRDSERVQKQMSLAAEINHAQAPPAQLRPRKEEPAQLEEALAPNRTGLPDQLKSGVESLSGLSLDDVKVHYNSDKPTQLNALAYAQGTDIHVAPGQEKHLPHEAWHIVQQKQGRVKPTIQMKKGVAVNDDPHLEREADIMGARASADKGSKPSQSRVTAPHHPGTGSTPVQARLIINDSEKANLGEAGAVVPEARGILEEWIKTGEHKHESWPIAIARAWLTYMKWPGEGDIAVVDPNLTEVNCHGFTFGQESGIDIGTPAEVLKLWDGKMPIAVCLKGNRVGHSAKLEKDGRYLQTLPKGPIFSTPFGILEKKYESVYKLPDHLEAFKRLAKDIKEEGDPAEEFEALKNEFCYALQGHEDYWKVTNLDYSLQNREALDDLRKKHAERIKKTQEPTQAPTEEEED